jgi:acyl-CoA thioester hydrolase
MSWDDGPEPVRIELPLRQRDADALGHVNQAVFHELLEEARAAFFRHAVPDVSFSGYVLAHVELDFRREIRLAERRVVGECRVAALGRSRIELENRLVLPDGGVAAEGTAVLVAWDEEARKARPLTEHERRGLLPAGDR